MKHACKKMKVDSISVSKICLGISIVPSGGKKNTLKNWLSEISDTREQTQVKDFH